MTSKLLPLLTWRSALCDSELAPPTRLVALTLSLYMNERGGSAHPGADRLAHDTGLSERSVRTHLGILADKGWLALTEAGGIKGARRRANEYQAQIPPLQELHPYHATPANDDTRPLQEDATTPAPAAPHLFKNSPLNSRHASQQGPTFTSPAGSSAEPDELPDSDSHADLVAVARRAVQRTAM